MAQKSLIEEALTDAEQVRETALANAKAQLEEAFTPRIQSMISDDIKRELSEEDDEYEDEEEMEEEEDYDEEEGEVTEEEDMEADEDEEELEEEEEEMGDVADEDGTINDPTNADDSSLEEEDYEDEEEEEDVDLDLESVIKELEDELEDDDEEEVNEEEDGEEEEEEDIVDLEELLKSISEEEEMEDEEDEETVDLEELFNSLKEDEEEDEEEEEVETLKTENEKLTSEIAEHREAVVILRSKLNEVNLLNAKLLYTSKLFKKYNLNNSQKMKVVESFDRTKSVRETKLVYSTLAESFNIGGSGKKGSRKTASITEGLGSKPVKSTKPTSNIIEESNDVSNRFKKLVNYNKNK